MHIFEQIGPLEEYLNSCREDGRSIALVPTMGGLHEGHLKLIDKAKECSDMVVASVFVNPTQFAENEDFEAYPKTLLEDKILLEAIKVDTMFVPLDNEVYPDGSSQDYDVGEMGKILCGISRPIHFNGVAQVVARLFDIVKPDYAVFGEKDYQQLLIINSLVERQGIKTTIVSVPTVRESDGLAMSTRNNYLSSEDRANAPLFYQQLVATKASIQNGTDIPSATEQAEDALGAVFDVEYIEVLNANNLTQITTSSSKIIIISAVRLRETRLIDNIVFRRSHV
ncbi:MAG: pantoate--beta-alanine ligase [Candidatus Thioglobus autotrophicus]|jgi:pantoate--beta-alanine ligase|nr:pantoate--beta-alanine ligase [Candidatus Thioglobus autotrophicus]